MGHGKRIKRSFKESPPMKPGQEPNQEIIEDMPKIFKNFNNMPRKILCKNLPWKPSKNDSNGLGVVTIYKISINWH